MRHSIGDFILPAAPETAPSGPCQCWANPPYLHDGHCCFRDPNFDSVAMRAVCGHDEEGMRLYRAASGVLDLNPPEPHP